MLQYLPKDCINEISQYLNDRDFHSMMLVNMEILGFLKCELHKRYEAYLKDEEKFTDGLFSEKSFSKGLMGLLGNGSKIGSYHIPMDNFYYPQRMNERCMYTAASYDYKINEFRGGCKHYTISIPRYGDMIDKAYLYIKSGSLFSLGDIDYICLDIGGINIDGFSGDLLKYYLQLYYPKEYKIFKKSIKKNIYLIPLVFFFHTSTLALRLITLPYSEVLLRVGLKKEIDGIKLLCSYVFIDDKERCGQASNNFSTIITRHCCYEKYSFTNSDNICFDINSCVGKVIWQVLFVVENDRGNLLPIKYAQLLIGSCVLKECNDIYNLLDKDRLKLSTKGTDKLYLFNFTLNLGEIRGSYKFRGEEQCKIVLKTPMSGNVKLWFFNYAEYINGGGLATINY